MSEHLRARVEAIGLDLDYWKHANDDLGRLSDLISEAATDVAALTVAGLSIAAIGDPRAVDLASDVMTASADVMGKLRDLQLIVLGMVELVDGRLLSLGAAIAAVQEGIDA